MKRRRPNRQGRQSSRPDARRRNTLDDHEPRAQEQGDQLTEPDKKKPDVGAQTGTLEHSTATMFQLYAAFIACVQTVRAQFQARQSSPYQLKAWASIESSWRTIPSLIPLLRLVADIHHTLLGLSFLLVSARCSSRRQTHFAFLEILVDVEEQVIR